MEISTQISKESLDDEAMYDRIRVLQASTESMMHEVVRVKPKMQWSSTEVREAKKVECLPRKDLGNKCSQFKREIANSNTIGTGLPKSVGAPHYLRFYFLQF
jgi:hypothetical protein